MGGEGSVFWAKEFAEKISNNNTAINFFIIEGFRNKR